MKNLFARHPRRMAVGLAVLLFLSAPFPSLQRGIPGVGPVSSFAQDEWKAEYDEVCSKTDLAMTLPKEELSALIDRCDKLRPKIEREDESTRKVYLRRLQMCRELFKYVLEAKEPK